jgi:hypothetical protein
MAEQQQKQLIDKTFSFDGEWIPDADPLKIGEKNFALLRNYRYVDDGTEPIEAYTEINTTALSSYPKVRSSIQLRSPYTQKTYVLAEAWNSALDTAEILVNKTTIPNQGDFDSETSTVFTPDTDGAVGRFSQLPAGVGYANEVESCIYEGDEMRVAAVIRCEGVSDLTLTDPVDFSEELTNESQASGQTMAMNATDNDYLVLSTRPLQGIKAYIKTANTETGTATIKEWQGSWSAALTITDNTLSGGITHAQTGTITWTATGSAKPAYIEGYYLYAYHITFTAAASVPDIYQITVDAPFQQIVDIWDGVFRACVACHVDISDTDNDYTLEVNEPSNIDYPIAARIGQLNTTDEIYLIFEEQAAAIKINMIGGGKVNTAASVMTVSYWNGDAYASVGTIYDGTIIQAGKTLSGSGVVSWDPIAKTTEKPRSLYGVTGYVYKITVSVQLSGSGPTDILIDLVSGVPAPRTLRGHKFTGRFQGRALFCCDTQAKEENRVDYTMTYAPDVHNGLESSDRGQALYFGGNEKLTCGGSLYNRFGSQIYETWLAYKESETYLLNGSGPEDFRIYQISSNYGCPAPETFDVAEIAYEMAPGAVRNIAIWLSYRGPVIFDGAVIVPLAGIDIYFDARKSTYINTAHIDKARGWFDPYWMEYNLLIPTGTSTICDTWLCYDLRRKRWFEKYPDGGSAVPQDAVTVRDEQGTSYIYVFTDDGIMHRDGYGTSWNGTAMIHKVKCADLMLGKTIFDIVRIDNIKILHQTPDFTESDDGIIIHINHYVNGRNDATTLDNFNLTYDEMSDTYHLATEAGEYLLTEAEEYILIDAFWYARYQMYLKALDLLGFSHQFEFWRQSDDYSYRETFGKKLLAWGIKGKAEPILTESK